MMKRDMVKRDVMRRDCTFISNHESRITNHASYFGGKRRPC